MSIYPSGAFTRSAGIIDAIFKQIKEVNLKQVKKIQVTFDPFHKNAITAREFLFFINSPRVTSTNLSCMIKPIVVCDRSEPEIKINLSDASIIRFKANNLTVLEILQHFNRLISSKVPVEEVSATLQTTKLEAKKLKRK